MQNKENNWLSLEEQTSEKVKTTAKEVNEFLENSQLETDRLLNKRKIALALNENVEAEIRFANPIVWMNYLVKTNADLQTVGDFVKYAQDSANGSESRFDLLNNGLKEKLFVDLTNPEDFPMDTSLKEFADGTIQLGVYMDEVFKNRWQDNEYKAQTDFPGEVRVDEVA